MSHRGSLLCLPSGIHGWEVTDHSQLSVDNFAKVLEQSTEIEFLLIGMGDSMRVVPRELKAALREAGISVDPMSTGAAVRNTTSCFPNRGSRCRPADCGRRLRTVIDGDTFGG